MEPNAPNALARIEKEYLSMSDVEKRIADHVLKNPQKAVNMTIRMMAAEAGVSEGSIVNFANQLGFSGFTKLKINIAQNLDRHNSLIFDCLSPGDGPREALRKMIDNATSAFESTYAILSQEELRLAASALMGAKKRIELYGVGSSSMVAADAYYRFMRAGLPAYAVTDPHIAPVSASMLDENCVAVGISHSGKTVETLEAMEIARKKRAKTICVTSHSDSPLARICDIPLVIASRESEIGREAVVSRLTHLMVLDSLCSYINLQRGDASLEYMQNMIDIIGAHRKTETAGEPVNDDIG